MTDVALHYVAMVKHIRTLVTMRNSLKYIFSFFLILSFFEFGESPAISCFSLKNIKETEWITEASSNKDVSKCYHYNLSSSVKDENLNLLCWSNEFLIFFNRTICIKLASQSNVFGSVKIIRFLINKLNIPRRSIEDHSVSCWHNVRNIRWNNKLNRKWINQQIESPDTSMELNVF